MEETLRSARSFEQFVLLSVVELAVADETPAHSYEVTETARDHLDDVDRDPFGGVERREVITALGALADDGLLSKATTESATGKGRPAYELAVAADAVLDELAGADAVGGYAETLRETA
ncbi:hypothetical protein [Haloarcula litorea]|uniref:hypothetical protein n=1 Tax=Haloarcula litorea TaxID=3032579 RepID=UPI0023E88EEA|nr:hypothetical protein [Halomicroarcula sp. GDY20]